MDKNIKVDKELEDQVAAVVASLFNEKEEEVLKRKTEEELTKSAASIRELTDALEIKDTEVSAIKTELESKEIELSSIKSELEAAKTDLENTKSDMAEIAKELEDIKKDTLAKERYVELESAGVASTDKKDEQLSKIKEMSDEAFASYKSELSSIRESILRELEAATKIKETEDAEKAAEAARAAEAASKAAEDNKNEDVDPANITPGNAAMAALNMEFVPSDDVVSKYADLGKAMAELWKKSEK